MMNPSKSKLIKIGSTLDVYRHYAESRVFDNEGLASRRATKRFFEEVDKIRPNVIHLHNIHDHYINYKILFKYLSEKKIPVIWTQHDQWASTGHCSINTLDCEKWKNHCCNCPVNKNPFIDNSYRNFNLKKYLFTSLESLTLVAVSNWLGNQLRQSFFSNTPIKVIKNGIDTNIFKPQDIDIRDKYSLGNCKIILGVSSAWGKNKGIEDYIQLRKKLSNDWIIVLVGLSPKVASKMPSGIIGIPRTQDQTELAMFYSSANIVMSLSSSETFGLTIAEGLACGTPAIVYNNTAQPELLSKETGYVVNNGDIEGLVNAVSLLAQKDKVRSSKCRERALEFYDKDKCFNSYLKLYEDVIK